MTQAPAIETLLHGCVDLHCHSGPNPFRRRLDHAEAAKDGERLGMRGVLVKSHHHNTVMDLLAMSDRLAQSSTPVFGGITLNNHVGGINPAAVAMSLRMGGRAVWFPTFSAGRHIECHPEGVGFPSAIVEVPNVRVDTHRDNGEFVPEVFEVLDLVKETGAMVTGGHMAPDAITQLFTEGRAKGITRMLVNHPDYVVDAAPDKCHELVQLGAYVEHEAGFYDPEGTKKWDPKLLLDWIEKIGPEHTVIASDLGQENRPMPVDAYIRVASALLDLGLDEKSLRLVFCDNPAFLLGLDD
ncbi:MAG: DUF6282 family protein [Actinomycetia bacterium]|nr:DUF6282 family protein [Actinomycetes bacterium]